MSTVGLNLLWLVPGDVGGSEDSTLATLRGLAEHASPDVSVSLFAQQALADAHPEVVAAFPTELFPTGRSRPARIAAESTWLPKRTRDLDLVHHMGGTAPPRRSGPYVLTVHDLQPLAREGTHTWLKRRYLAVALPRSARAAELVVVPSEFVRGTLIEHVPHLAPERVAVVPHAVEAHPGPTAWGLLADRYALDGPVVLYPAITYPHKNHAVLVEAFALLLEQHPDAVLVLTGGAGGSDDAVRAQVAALGIGDRVKRTGRISAADVAGLYTGASVVAVPSCYEGFGLPAVEAMAYGVPVVAADATALPEVVSGAGLLVAPDDVAGWAAALDRVLADPNVRSDLAAGGRARAATFSRAANAQRHLQVYRQAVS